jgi:hypothetical protein
MSSCVTDHKSLIISVTFRFLSNPHVSRSSLVGFLYRYPSFFANLAFCGNELSRGSSSITATVLISHACFKSKTHDIKNETGIRAVQITKAINNEYLTSGYSIMAPRPIKSRANEPKPDNK